MKVVFTGWRTEVKTVSLIHLIAEKASVSLSRAKGFVDALVNIPVIRFEMVDAQMARETASELSRFGLPCSARGAIVFLSGWKQEVDESTVVDLLARGSSLPMDKVAELVRSMKAGAIVEVACPSESLAQELAGSAGSFGAVCHVEI
jgi:hypothetical protein